jgi:hypothetical protein
VKTLRNVLVLALAVLALGCDKKEDAAAKDIGQQTADITADTETLREANAAVNEVVRNAAECEAARPAVATANQKLDEAGGRVRTATGRQTLEALRVQVRRVSDLCP